MDVSVNMRPFDVYVGTGSQFGGRNAYHLSISQSIAYHDKSMRVSRPTEPGPARKTRAQSSASESTNLNPNQDPRNSGLEA